MNADFMLHKHAPVLKGKSQRAFTWLAKRMLHTRRAAHLLADRPQLAAAFAGPQLARRLLPRLYLMRPHARLGIVALAVAAALAGLMAPYYQKLFIDELTALPSMTHTAAKHLIYLVSISFGAMLMSQGLNVIVRALCSREGAIAQQLLCDALYGHTLRLRGTARSTHTVGDTVNFFAQDVQAAVSGLEDLAPSIIASFIPLILAPIFVSYLFAMPLGAVLLTIGGTIAILFAMSWRQSGFFDAFKRLAGERLSIVNEWLQNMRIIRILGWIQAFETRIFTKRIEETNNRLKMVTNGSAMNSLAQVAPLLVNVVGIAVLITARHDQVTAGDVFALMWIFAVFLARPLRMLPWTLVVFVDVLTSCRRLEGFFSLPQESDPRRPQTVKVKPRADADINLPVLSLRGLQLELGRKIVLENIDLDVSNGEFIAITGDVGSGKSQLLLSLLMESPAVFSSYTVAGADVYQMTLEQLRGHFAFVPQDGFVMSASVRENVVFEYQDHKNTAAAVDASLTASQFIADKDQLPNGVDTEIGERGVNLSGGQRQRIALARAAFNDRPIILLDDCLSAVDVETERKLIASLICGIWAHKTRILVTHRLSILPFADRVFELEDGRLRPMPTLGKAAIQAPGLSL